VSNIHEAHKALGGRLRELRRKADLSGVELAKSLSWQASKVSKIENAKQTPSDEDIRLWTKRTGDEDQAADLLASLHTLELQHAEWQRQLRGGLKPHQNAIAEINARTRFFRAFEPTYIPGLLQTAGYARARFEQSVAVFTIRDDINEAVQARIQRQDILRAIQLAA
jgi:transcriptional regulator with XRE-family HTH domain